MREIRFRAWDKQENIMHDVECVYMEPSGSGKDITVKSKDEESVLEWLSFDDAELMQYTGLKDKNGTEIYEGDIVENASKDLKFQVVYEAPSFNRKWIDDTSKRYREHLTEPLAWNTHIICEIIGNIYENHELLGDSQ